MILENPVSPCGHFVISQERGLHAHALARDVVLARSAEFTPDLAELVLGAVTLTSSF
jgi:hypothetical protein